MRSRRDFTLDLCVLTVVLFGAAVRASAAEPPGALAPSMSRSLAARGPVALSIAAEPGGLHWGFETGIPLGFTRRDGSATPHRIEGPWRLDAFTSASHDRERAFDASSLSTSLRLERADAHGANWWGVSRGGPRGAGDPEARLRLAFGRLQMLAGVHAEVAWIASSVLFRDDPRWYRTYTLRTFTPSDTSPGFFTDSTVVEHASHAALWNTAQGSLRWQRGRLALESVGGLSLGDGTRSRRWAQATVNVQVTPRVLLMASLGERPAPSLAFHGDAQPRTMLGFQFAPWATPGWAMSGALRPVATAWEARAVGRDRLLVRVHGRDVSRVELSGDFTDWTAVALLPVHANWWSAVVRVPPGVHRVQIRLNGGAWLAPPHLPRADDGPGGPSGTLIVTGGG